MSNGWNFSGAGLQAAASIAGGIMSAKQAKKWRKLQKDIAQKQIRWRVDDAKAAGIHPLAALGISPSSGTGFVGAGDYGIGGAAEAMGQAFRQQGALSSDEKKIIREKARQEELKTEILGKERDALYNAKNKPVVNTDDGLVSSETGISLPGQDQAQMQMTGGYEGGIYGTGPQTGTILDYTRTPVSQTQGVEAGIRPAEAFYISKSGRLYITLTKDLQEAMEDNFHFKMQYYGEKMDDYIKGWFAAVSGPGGKYGKEWMRFWNKILPDPGKGYRWQYRTAGGYFQKVKIGSRPSRWQSQSGSLKKRPDWNSLNF